MSFLEHRVLGLPLCADIKKKLLCCGFNTVGDIKGHLNVEELKSITKLNDQDVKRVIEVVKPYINPSSDNKNEYQLSFEIVMRPVSRILKSELAENRYIVSFSSQVDALLGGGFPLGRLTEIAGEAGLGKTQFVFQLCVDIQIPKTLGGLDAEAVFVDVEGTFVPQRVKQIANAAVEHCERIVEQSPALERTEVLKNFTVESIMSRIYLFRCCDSIQLMAACHQMAHFLRSHPKAKLVVIDSIAQSLRGEDDYVARTKFLSTLRGIFYKLIYEFDIAIVLTNQVTTKIEPSGKSYNIPALGAKWSHVPNIKLMLYKENGKRYARQYKSPDMPDGVVEYSVTGDGIRDSREKDNAK